MLEKADPALINDDLRPVPAEARHFDTWSLAALWIGMVVCVPSYTLAAGLVGDGMNAWQAVLTVLLGNLVVLGPMILNGHPGTKYGIPFPVLARSSFGVHGAHIPALMRALVACGWFGIQTWFGGLAIFKVIDAAVEADLAAAAKLPVLGISGGELACYVGFWALQLAIIWRGIETIRIFENLAAPFLIAMGLALLVWAWVKADGFGPALGRASAFGPGGAKEGQFWAVFFPSLNGIVAFWATLSLNISDFTRYAKSQRDQVLGQAIGLPTTMTLFALICVVVTSATIVIFPDQPNGVSDPVTLAGMIGGASVVVSLLALSVATLSTNIAANAISPANALINAFPRHVGFKAGATITAVVGLLMFPWKLIENTQAYIFTWLGGYGTLIAPVGGIMVVDYFLIRRKELDLEGLYRKDGPYWYQGGFNGAALAAMAIGIAPNVPGFLRASGMFGDPKLLCPGPWDRIYSLGVFVGFGIAGLVYWALMQLRARPTPGAA